MSFSTRLFPHSLIGIVSVLPALLVMPAMAYVLPTDGSTITGDLDEMQVVLSGRKVAFENVSASGVVEPQYSGAVIENLGNATMSGDNLFTLNSAPAGGVLYNTGTMNLNGVFGGIDDTDPEHPLSLGNSASNGGAIYNANTGRMEVGGTFTSNNASSWGGAIYNAGNLTVADNTAFNYNKVGSIGGAITNALGTSVLTLGSGVTFTGNEAGNDGGAIGNYKGATLVNGTTFTGNKAQTGTNDVDAIGGGAMSLGAESTTQIANATFDSNTSGFNGGAIGTRNALSASNVAAALDITDSTFTGNKALGTVTSTFKDGAISLTGGNGGALDNHFYNSEGKDGYAYVSGSTFTDNEALNGGAIYNNGTEDSAGKIAKLYLSDSTFSGNQASGRGGAIYNEGTLVLKGVDFKDNLVTTKESKGSAIYNNGTVTIDNASFSGNKSTNAFASGSAIYNDYGATMNISNSLFDSHEMGALYDDGGTVTLTDTSFKNNTSEDFGAIGIWNEHSVITINALKSDVVFSGNTATEDADAGDIVNSKGTIYLNAANGRTISMDGGINGLFGAANQKLYINSAEENTGKVDLAGSLKKHTVEVARGELHLSNGLANGSNLKNSTVTVNSGAILNSQDGVINNYSSYITLGDGAKVVADANASSMDKFGIASGNTVTLSGLKMLADLETSDPEDRDLATAGHVTIDPSLKVYTTAHKYAVTGNASDNGKITIAKDGIGGLSAAVTSTDAGAQETVNYAITGAVDDATVTADVEIKKAAFTLVGAGTEAGDTGVTLDKKLAVDGTSSLSVENAKIAGEGSIENANELSVNASNVDVDVNNAGNTTFTDTTFAAGNTFTNAVGATTTLLDSIINGTFRNFGIVHSDPTTIAGLYDNVGYTDFDNDTFDTTAELHNTGTVDLKNSVAFESGATITGDGVINMLSGTTHFNNTASSNTLKLASGAKFDGTLASTGVLDTRNANIDTGLGTVTGGDLFVDANLVAGSVDSFADTTGVTIKGIKLANAGYGTSNKVELDFGAASLDANVQVEGTNYFTKVEKDGDNIVFSDKLINESNLDAKLGSWTGGNYIGTNSDMTHDANGTTYQNVGQALKNLDTNVKTNADAIATLNGDSETAGSVDYKIANALSTSGSGGAISNAIDDKITAAVAENGTVTNAIAGATTMGASAGNNYAANNTVVEAIETIDTNIGKVHGLIGHVGDNEANPLEFHGSGTTASTNVVSGEYKGNLAVGTTIEDHLVSLDNTIGTMSALDMTNGVLDNTMSVAQNLQNLDTAIANVRTSALADANAYTDNRIESLDKNLSAGVAGAVALSSVAVSGVERGEVSVGAGYGYFTGQSAAAFGAAVGLSNRWSVNAGAGISNADVSFRAGTNYKFKLF